MSGKNVPVLRFKADDGATFPEWEERRLGEILTVKYGKDHKDLADGDIPVYGTGGIIRFVDTAISNKPSVLIGRKGTIDKPRFVTEPFWTVDTLFYTEINDNYVPFFVFQAVTQINWLKYNEATGVPSLNATAINSVKFHVPTEKEEQQKIAAFLSTVDNKLSALRRKHELLQTYKRGVMQRIFSRELRFKADDGAAFPEWEERRLGDVAHRCTKKNTDIGISRVLTNSATQGVVDQQAYFDKDIANADNLDGYYIVEKGDYVYNPRISTSAPVGPINKNKLGTGVMSPLYTVFRFNSKNNDFTTTTFIQRLGTSICFPLQTMVPAMTV